MCKAGVLPLEPQLHLQSILLWLFCQSKIFAQFGLCDPSNLSLSGNYNYRHKPPVPILKCVSCRQQIVGSRLKKKKSNLCLVIEARNVIVLMVRFEIFILLLVSFCLLLSLPLFLPPLGLNFNDSILSWLYE
jgi:hypothetical protein